MVVLLVGLFFGVVFFFVCGNFGDEGGVYLECLRFWFVLLVLSLFCVIFVFFGNWVFCWVLLSGKEVFFVLL